MSTFPPSRRKTVALVGLMGVGKSSIGRRLATALGMPFRDADTEVEAAAGRSIPEIFEHYGEQAFREGERRVIARLLEEPVHVLATGGGAFIDEQTRQLIQERAVSVWLPRPILRCSPPAGWVGVDTRPLLSGKDPSLRSWAPPPRPPAIPSTPRPILSVETGDTAHQVAVDAIVKALASHAAAA